eukprot:3327127-Amphidinium_carterae.1
MIQGCATTCIFRCSRAYVSSQTSCNTRTEIDRQLPCKIARITHMTSWELFANVANCSTP